MTRLASIDLLRALGMLLVVLAHVGPPAWLAQLRNFDVPLLLLVAGLAHAQSQAARSYLAQLRVRAERLLLPSWLFLIAYFAAWPLLHGKTWPDGAYIRDSFLMSGGIGYLWIFKVMLGVALLTPLLERWSRWTASPASWLLVWGVALLSLDGIRLLVPETVRGPLDQTLFLVLPYALCFVLGLRLPSLPRRAVRGLAVGAALVCLMLALLQLTQRGAWPPTQTAKYPPQLYYLSYALAVALLLWDRADWLQAGSERLALRPLLDFLARHSVWFYLWHIALLPHARGPWALQFLEVLGGALLLTALQLALLERLLVPRLAPGARAWVRRVLMG